MSNKSIDMGKFNFYRTDNYCVALRNDKIIIVCVRVRVTK